MDTITLHLSIEDTNLILESLGNLPFVKVYALISTIQEQARQQLSANSAPEAASPQASLVPSSEG
jgi:hypothetical protein